MSSPMCGLQGGQRNLASDPNSRRVLDRLLRRKHDQVAHDTKTTVAHDLTRSEHEKMTKPQPLDPVATEGLAHPVVETLLRVAVCSFR